MTGVFRCQSSVDALSSSDVEAKMRALDRVAGLFARKSRSESVRAAIESIDLPSLHVAIIMDGNGRWATQRGLPRLAGHRAGSQNAKRIVEHAASLGIGHLTLFVFSTENWSRPDEEVGGLMRLFRESFSSYFRELLNSNVRVRTIGRSEGLPDDIQLMMRDAEERTKQASGMVLTFAINYGGRAEIVDCVRSIARDVAAGSLQPQSIDEETIAGRLYTASMPDPDLIIRTSGELRLSNFLLWQSAYAEIVPIEALWPDFTAEDFDRALAVYAKRQRRYGGIAEADGGE